MTNSTIKKMRSKKTRKNNQRGGGPFGFGKSKKQKMDAKLKNIIDKIKELEDNDQKMGLLIFLFQDIDSFYGEDIDYILHETIRALVHVFQTKGDKDNKAWLLKAKENAIILNELFTIPNLLERDLGEKLQSDVASANIQVPQKDRDFYYKRSAMLNSKNPQYEPVRYQEEEDKSLIEEYRGPPAVKTVIKPRA